MQLYLLTDALHVIRAVGASAERIEQPLPGVFFDGTIYPDYLGLSLHAVEGLPEGVYPDKFCYTPEDGFYRNPLWIPGKTEIDMRLADLEAAIAAIIGGGV